MITNATNSMIAGINTFINLSPLNVYCTSTYSLYKFTNINIPFGVPYPFLRGSTH